MQASLHMREIEKNSPRREVRGGGCHFGPLRKRPRRRDEIAIVVRRLREALSLEYFKNLEAANLAAVPHPHQFSGT